MSEKRLKVVLSAIPTVLLIVCLVAAFSAQGWNVQATIFAGDPLELVEKLLLSEIGTEEELLKVTGYGLSEDGSKLILKAVFHSPLNVPIEIKEMSADLSWRGITCSINLPEEVEVPAKGSADLELEGSLSAVQFPSTLSSVDGISNMNMRLEIGGIGIELEESGFGS